MNILGNAIFLLMKKSVCHSSLRCGLSLVFSFSVLALFSACTDYVSKIDAQNDDEPMALSSSSILHVSSSSVVNPSTVVVKSMKDYRDGQSYKTVTIGSQTWMAQNLNYETDDYFSFCNNNILSNCTKYGRLYSWKGALTACPVGWHLPAKAEFDTLFTAVGGRSVAGSMLKSTNGWNDSGNGTDDYSFSALPAGYYYVTGDYELEGGMTCFWSSAEDVVGNALCLYKKGDYVSGSLGNKNLFAFSVRCVQD